MLRTLQAELCFLTLTSGPLEDMKMYWLKLKKLLSKFSQFSLCTHLQYLCCRLNLQFSHLLDTVRVFDRKKLELSVKQLLFRQYMTTSLTTYISLTPDAQQLSIHCEITTSLTYYECQNYQSAIRSVSRLEQKGMVNSDYSLTSHSTCNRSFWGRVFPGNLQCLY